MIIQCSSNNRKISSFPGPVTTCLNEFFVAVDGLVFSNTHRKLQNRQTVQANDIVLLTLKGTLKFAPFETCSNLQFKKKQNKKKPKSLHLSLILPAEHLQTAGVPFIQTLSSFIPELTKTRVEKKKQKSQYLPPRFVAGVETKKNG